MFVTVITKYAVHNRIIIIESPGSSLRRLGVLVGKPSDSGTFECTGIGLPSTFTKRSWFNKNFFFCSWERWKLSCDYDQRPKKYSALNERGRVWRHHYVQGFTKTWVVRSQKVREMQHQKRLVVSSKANPDVESGGSGPSNWRST